MLDGVWIFPLLGIVAGILAGLLGIGGGLILVAALVWLAGMMLTAGVRENMSANDLLVAIVIVALTWTIYWFARHSRQREWLR